MDSITVSDDATVHAYGPPRPVENRAQKRYDEMRRPQGALMFRMLRDRHEEGASWKECWALGEGNEGWDVGPIVVWLRSKGVSIDARYDVVAGETRFYLTEPLALGVSGGPS